MIQNVSAERTDKKVTKRDLVRIACAAFLPHFGGGTLQYSNGWVVKKYSSVMALFYIQGTGNNKGKIMWIMYQNGISGTANGILIQSSGVINGWAVFARDLTCGVEYDLDVIHKGLKINAGDIKIVVNAAVYIDIKYVFSNGVNIKSTPSLWGFFILIPKTESPSVGQEYFYCNMEFTPNFALFNEKGPQ
ncbi:MAG: hypothetical protein LBB21_00290 [Holosporaceae bacterium]|jgi:hypothetical protein|nr:hypothetical protein [Holosporaceae bacterium]